MSFSKPIPAIPSRKPTRSMRASPMAPEVLQDGAPSRWAIGVSMDDDSLETILSLIKQMESTLLGLKQLRHYVGRVSGQRCWKC